MAILCFPVCADDSENGDAPKKTKANKVRYLFFMLIPLIVIVVLTSLPLYRCRRFAAYIIHNPVNSLYIINDLT